MARRSKIFTVHIHPDGQQPYDSTRLVPEGFSFFAFLFHGLWLLYHRAWVLGVMMTALIVALHFAGEYHYLSVASVALLQFLLRVYIGLQAYDWQREVLVKRGYVMVDMVAADSWMDAQQKFFERRMVTVPHMAGGL